MAWLLATTTLLVAVLAGCGGGTPSADVPPALDGTRETRSIHSRLTGDDYTLSIYLPPASAGPRGNLPIVYMLDGESWFETLVGIAESTKTRLIIVGIGASGQRNRDFVPPNNCTPNGDGHAAYHAFIRQELLPYVGATIGGDARQRTLFGHSHGGSFVLYAMFSVAPGEHSFRTYLASDASVSCMPGEALGWEHVYALSYRDLPVRLHLSYASLGNYSSNLAYADLIRQEGYGRLVFTAQAYAGTHSGIVPQVLADGIAFALVGDP